MISRRSMLAASAGAAVAADAPKPKKAEIVSVARIWDAAPHSAFTDLVRFRGRFYCAFREGAGHVSPDGAIRILSSPDAVEWVTSARLDYPVADLRDPKLCLAPDGRLMLTAAAAMHPPSDFTHHTMVWFSLEGRDWTPAERIGEPNVWLWRVAWQAGKCYGMGYSVTQDKFARMYISADGKKFTALNRAAFQQDYPSESSIVFLPGDEAICLLRREGGPGTAVVGRSRPPYRGWEWSDAGIRFGGPHLIRLDDARIVAAGRAYDGGARTALCWLDAVEGKLNEFLRLPSGGDTSYPGLVMHDGLLHVSYYSGHEGKCCIYLAKVKLPPVA